ncbi:MAG: hypothetical protein WAO76_11630, partial [Georgfuchsia sp.]
VDNEEAPDHQPRLQHAVRAGVPGVLGGVVAFGLTGVFLGPTLLAVGYRLLNEWSSALVEPANEVPPAE